MDSTDTRAAHAAAAAAHAAPIRTDAEQDAADAATRAATAATHAAGGSIERLHAHSAQNANDDGDHEQAASWHRSAESVHLAGTH